MHREPGEVVGGVDTHLNVHVAAVIDHIGQILATRSFPTTPAGYRQLLAWMRRFGELRQVGIEGTGAYGAGLARYLISQDLEVVGPVHDRRVEVRGRRADAGTVDADDAHALALGVAARLVGDLAAGTRGAVQPDDGATTRRSNCRRVAPIINAARTMLRSTSRAPWVVLTMIG